METKDLTSIKVICKRYNIPVSFINALHEFQLIEVIVKNDSVYMYTIQIKEVEKIMRLHYDLNINFEGVDAIYNLLKQVEFLKREITVLNNRLEVYENH